MENIPAKIARYLLGIALVVFGANKFLGFIPVPPHAPAAEALLHALAASGYLFIMVAITELGCGILLLSGFFVPLALVMLAPLSLNIVLFHLFLDPAGIVPAAIIASLNLYLALTQLRAYQDILMPR